MPTLDENHQCIAVFGGVYNNHIALDAIIEDARAQGAQKIFNLGDVGGFGPHPNLSVERLRQGDVLTMQGNYDQSIGEGLDDCQCGYTDPRDNHFAQISYNYTLSNTRDTHRRWLRDLPGTFRLGDFGGLRVLMAHGSPRRINEFLWASTTPEPFIQRLLDDNDADLILVTHTGIHWKRFLSSAPERGIVNVGAIGRPPNDGQTGVYYALLRVHPERPHQVETQFRRVEYDCERLASQMRGEGLPEEFVETILTGWWTTCLEILPAKERSRSRF